MRSPQNVIHSSSDPFPGYTESEWAAIAKAVQAVQAVRADLPLSARECRRLHRAAFEYRSKLRAKPWLKDRSVAVSKAWTKVAALSGKLRAALAEAVAHHHTDSQDRYSRHDRAVTKIEKDAQLFASATYAIDKDATNENYYKQVFALWTDVGGKLTVTNKDVFNSGKLIEFFRSVTVPVMGGEALQPSGIDGALDREKERRAAASGSIIRKGVEHRTKRKLQPPLTARAIR